MLSEAGIFNRMFAFSIRRVAEPHGRRGISGARHAHAVFCGHHVTPQRLQQWLEQSAGLAHPVDKGGEPLHVLGGQPGGLLFQNLEKPL